MKKVICIISRIGGTDGVAMQYENYARILKGNFGFDLQTITGFVDERFGRMEQGDISLIPLLAVENKTNLWLYENMFSDKYTEDWQKVFSETKDKVYRDLKKKIEKIRPDFIFMHNILSLSHFHIASAIALRELIRGYPEITFVAHAPDSDFERAERLKRVHKRVISLLSSQFDNDGLPFPFYSKNLYYIILNSSQRNAYLEKYGFPKSHVFVVPDFEDTSVLKSNISQGKFLEYLGRHKFSIAAGEPDKNSIRLDKDDIFILFAVRPIERKKILECMLIGHLIQKMIRNANLHFIITHPYSDEGDGYFNEILSLAKRLTLSLIYLGDEIMLRKNKPEDITLNDVLVNLARLRTFGFVGSSMGGWENVTVELSKHRIPVFINPDLPSYPDMKSLGFKYIELPIEEASNLLKDIDAGTLLNSDKKIPGNVGSFITEFTKMLENRSELAELAKHNSKVVEENLSVSATTKKIELVFRKIGVDFD